MALTTAAAFDEFYERIRPSSSQEATVSQRKNAVVATLKNAFPATSDVRFQDAWLVGSLGRKTASKPVSDVDLLVHLHVEEGLWERSYSKDSSRFLYRVRDSVNSTSTVQTVGARGQAVRLFYTDGLSVDIAAVERYSNGSFAIPDGSGRWLGTNPLEHAAYIDRKNAALDMNLKRFVQIAKQWNAAHSSYLRSFHFEILAARTFATLGTNSRQALKMFFDYNYNNLSVDDPSGFSGDLSTYLTASQRQAVNLNLSTASARASSAQRAEGVGDHREAIRLWRIVLGDIFPTYG